MAICFVILVVLYFLFKNLVKLALVFLILAVAIGGYFYFQHPENRPANLKEAVDKGKQAVGKGKEFLDRGRDAFEKGSQAVEKGKEAIGKGIDKGKEVTGEVGKFLGGEKEAGKQ